MGAPKKRLGEILKDAGIIDEFQINTALTEQKRWGGKVGEHLIKLGYVTEEAMLDVLRNHLKVPTVNLLKVKIPKEVLVLLPEDVVRKYRALPVGVKSIQGKDHLVVAMDDPSNLSALDEMQFSTKLKLMPALAGPITLERALRYYYDNQGDLFTEEEQDAFSPTQVRERVDITDGSRTVTGDSFDADPGKAPKASPPQPPGPPSVSAPISAGEDDLQQVRAELTALRNLLIEKGLIDRKAFVEQVVKVKQKK